MYNIASLVLVVSKYEHCWTVKPKTEPQLLQNNCLFGVLYNNCYSLTSLLLVSQNF